ncbi:L,D-transpeptidase family protein [Micromonospora chalcea]|uniref:L,D-transpeptidase family protein n=1 Tax=Micromonospora sp. TSRI0369 TaxID=1703936 RepID=UPI00093C7EC3|nr:L,D-transpeptidase family protein [Micromonospora sp. TSRI0369]
MRRRSLIVGAAAGIAANPGVRYPYHQVVTDDWWDENPKSSAYNTFRHTAISPGGYSEALWKEKPAYTHFAVVTYNMAPNVPKPVPNAGSGIFLHEFSRTPSGPTAGCVSLSHADLVGVLPWLDPAAAAHRDVPAEQHRSLLTGPTGHVPRPVDGA